MLLCKQQPFNNHPLHKASIPIPFNTSLLFSLYTATTALTSVWTVHASNSQPAEHQEPQISSIDRSASASSTSSSNDEQQPKKKKALARNTIRLFKKIQLEERQKARKLVNARIKALTKEREQQSKDQKDTETNRNALLKKASTNR